MDVAALFAVDIIVNVGTWLVLEWAAVNIMWSLEACIVNRSGKCERNRSSFNIRIKYIIY